MKKRIVAIGLIAILIVSTLAGCSCSNGTKSDTNNTTTTAYKPDFSEKDIAIPEGTKLTDNGLEVTYKADATVKNVLDIEKQLPAIIARDGDEPSVQQKYMQDCSRISNDYENFNYVDNYNEDTTNKSKETLKKVKNYAEPLAKTAIAFYKGNNKGVFNGVKDTLKAFGIFGGGKPGVSNEQILDEVKQVRMEVEKVYSQVQQLSLDVRDVRSLLSVMTNQLDDVAKQSYRNGLETFDNAMIALDTDAEIIQKMLVVGAQLLEQQGVYPPTEDSSPEEAQDYNAKLIATIEEQQSTNPELKNFDTIMNDLINNYVLVAGELGKGKDFSPITSYDQYWNTYFNWESQGYALKVAYRSNAEFQVKRGYSIITLYYNIGTGDTAQIYEKYGTLFNNALTSMSENEPGISPDDVANSREKLHDSMFAGIETTAPWININIEGGLYTSTFDKHLINIYRVSGVSLSDEIYEMSAQMPKELVIKYHEKLHGKTLGDDFRLAGLYDEEMRPDYDVHDLAFDFTKEGKSVRIDWLSIGDNKFYEGKEVGETGYIYKHGDDAGNMFLTKWDDDYVDILYGWRIDMMLNLK